MSLQRNIGLALALLTIAAVMPLPTAAASTCTATATSPCAFSCTAGEPITVSATGTGVVAGVCSSSAAECAVQSGTCTLVSLLAAISSGSGECVFVGEGSGTCSASTDPRTLGRCGSEGAPALGVISIGGVAYVDDRNYALGNGIWLYLETNAEPGLQRGGASFVIPDDPEICDDGHFPPDALVF